MDTLVLNVSYQPIDMVSWERAMTLWAEGKVEVVERYVDRVVRSARESWNVPSIIRFLKKTKETSRRPKFSRYAIFARDRGKCAYCAAKLSRAEFQLEHIVPRAQGGKTCWENTCLACMPCNMRKRDRTPQQAGMKLLIKPVKPQGLVHMPTHLNWKRGMPESWKDYLASESYWNGELDNDMES